MNKFINAVIRSCVSKEARFNYLAAMAFFDDLSDKEFLEKKFKATFGVRLNLEEPKTFNEKMQWLKLYNRKPEYTMMVDKFLVRNYISKTIGSQYLIPLLGVWNSPEEIDFSKLPEKFVLKCNHNSGKGMCICTDKKNLNLKKIKINLKKGLNQDYYLNGREWPYKNVQRKIIAEKYMVDDSGFELKDYKIYNFNGQPKVIEVDFNRFIDHKRNFYTTKWEKIDLMLQFPSDSTVQHERPQCLEKMLDLAKQLSVSLPFVRTDFYCINGVIYFGEITFFHGSGFEKFIPEVWNKIFGEWIKLPEDNLKDKNRRPC